MTKETFSPYQKIVVAILAFLQFTIILDFMVLAPLGAVVIKELAITPSQFGLVVSAYAFSAGVSGILAAGIADRFDRRKLLLAVYVGFLFGTLLCGLATGYRSILVARVVTGAFGGIVGSIAFAIIADLFPLSMRGRVMGLVQTAFAVSQVLGIPIGLYLAAHFSWHSPFFLITGVGLVAGIFMMAKLEPVTAHLQKEGPKQNPFAKLATTAANSRYIAGFMATLVLSIGGFMLMPFGSTFVVQNLLVPLKKLPTIYMVTGLSSMFFGPLLGRVSDSFGKYRTFLFGSVFSIVILLYYTGLKEASLSMIIGLNILIFVGISARMVSSSALSSALPGPADRGAFMSISSSLQQIAGGLASWAAGNIVHQANPDAPLEHYDRLGWVVAGAMTLSVVFMYRVHRLVSEKGPGGPPVASGASH